MTPEQRHNNMAAIHGKDTKPELLVRKFLWANGYRYRCNDRRFPGKPDIVISRYKTCIFINGCFWHGHQDCKYFRIPKSNTEFWENKISRNMARDTAVLQKIGSMGWHTIIIWECELKPAVREATLSQLLDLLGKFFLDDHRISTSSPKKRTFDDVCEEETRKIRMAAEEEVRFTPSTNTPQIRNQQ